jgi:hypothetical protein
MTEEIHLMAADLIEEVGEQAPGQAAFMADMMMARGNVEVAGTWARIPCPGKFCYSPARNTWSGEASAWHKRH